MKRSISSFVFVLAAAMTAPAAVAYADDPPPSAKDIEAAKKAFAAGKKLHEQGKLPEAIEKFKESYRLSKNPLLLYNIGLTMEEAGMEDLALFYFRKFLAEAPADAQQRDVVTERVKGLEKKFGVGGTTTTTTTKPDPATKPDPNANKPVDIKPAGTYSASDFQHQIVDAAPPGKPLDVTAFVPEDSGFTVTLHYRAAGEATFKAKPMKWRYKELVGRIPAGKMAGSAVQYYVEVKDQAGNVVTRSGKSTSPNQVLIEADATPRFYPDVSDDGDAQISDAQIKARDDEDDPLVGKRPKPKKTDDIIVQPIEQGPPGTGFSDVGSSKFTYAKWGTTATAATLLGFGVFSVIQAGKYASSLEEDASKCGAPPCNQFDGYAQDLESSGKRWQTFGNVGIGVGLGVGVVAGYFWYKELRAKKRGDMKVGAAAPGETTSTSSWIFAPQIGHGYSGAAAAVRF